jgi:hypothetical protein
VSDFSQLLGFSVRDALPNAATQSTDICSEQIAAFMSVWFDGKASSFHLEKQRASANATSSTAALTSSAWRNIHVIHDAVLQTTYVTDRSSIKYCMQNTRQFTLDDHA